VYGRAGAAVGEADVGQMQMLDGSEAVGPEDDGDGDAAAGDGLLRLALPPLLHGAGAIRTPMQTTTIAGYGTGTSGRMSAHNPILIPGTDAELSGRLGDGRREEPS
jgi:hypothetical protein